MKARTGRIKSTPILIVSMAMMMLTMKPPIKVMKSPRKSAGKKPKMSVVHESHRSHL